MGSGMIKLRITSLHLRAMTDESGIAEIFFKSHVTHPLVI
jgi:hypothetical protein